MSLNLREVNKTDEKELAFMYKEYMDSELIPGIERFEGIRDLEKFETMNFEDWFDDLEKNKYEENLPEDYSPHILYLAINNEKIVGAIGLRWKQVPRLMSHGGLIGYSIRPSERGKGYASAILPHITVAFPFLDNISNDEVMEKLKEILKFYKPFNVTFKGVSLSFDNYIFLNCINGNNEIIKLHDEIYEKIIPNHLKKNIKYIPHITLGQSNTLTELKGFNDEFKTVINEISLEFIGKNEKLEVIKKLKL